LERFLQRKRLKVIQESMPQLCNTDQKEIELDMDTLWKPYTYVVVPKPAAALSVQLPWGKRRLMAAAAVPRLTTSINSTLKRRPNLSPSPKRAGKLSKFKRRVEKFERAESGSPQSAAAVADISLSKDKKK
jgi:hypothetical protein